ncbi:MAG: hypothetical protein BHV59_06525 [Bifidobacterium sp. 56_9_plus]|nr:MAG: hypothetical protein BHV59_06525 [Bifidobacterium sp. 56_9_plus]
MPKTTIFDVAEYILSKSDTITAMKLEKLCYYSQAWSLVWDERPLFGEKFQAWANGPVCPELYARHRGEFNVTPGEFRGDPGVLDKSQRDTVDAVLGYYGTLSAYELSTLTHREAPWKDARGDIEPGQRSNNVISNASMAEYYGSLTD